MTTKTEPGRGMTPAKEKFWKETNQKVELMRLRWFTKNQLRLKEIAEKESARKGLSPEVLAEVERMRVERYRTMERFGRKKGQELDLPEIDPNCIMNVMKPVPEKIKKLLYTSKKLLPDSIPPESSYDPYFSLPGGFHRLLPPSNSLRNDF